MRMAAAALLVLLSMTPSLAQGTTSRDRIMETVQTFIRANETANLELIVGTFDDAATVFFPDGRAQRADGVAPHFEVFLIPALCARPSASSTLLKIASYLFQKIGLIATAG